MYLKESKKGLFGGRKRRKRLYYNLKNKRNNKKLHDLKKNHGIYFTVLFVCPLSNIFTLKAL